MTTAAAGMKLRPRDCVKVYAIGGPNVSEQMYQLAQMRLAHPGGVPLFEPPMWSGAFAGKKLLAAVGWQQVLPNLVWVIEVNRLPDKWGRVGTLVLFEQFKKTCEDRGTKVQALVLPSNTALKGALSQLGMRLTIEVFE